RVLIPRGSPLDQGDRSIPGLAVAQELLPDIGEVFHTHIDREGIDSLGQMLPGKLLLRPFFSVTRDKCDGGTVFPVGDRDARTGRGGYPCSDPRNHFKINTVADQNLGLLPTSTIDKGIPPFETGDGFSG